MNYRQLGATGIQVSEIGFGAWGIGGSQNGDVAYGPADSNESLRALRRALELGITFYDTSDFYGYGHSEELIGQAFQEVRDQVVIATKVGLLDAAGTQDFSPDQIRRSINESLRRLRTDYIDLYQLHSPSLDTLADNTHLLPLLQSLQQEGKIRAYGISVRSPSDGLEAVTKYGFTCLQANFNMLDQRAEDNGLFQLSLAQNVGIIARTPLCFGFLTGKYSDSSTFHPLDHRLQWSSGQIKRWADAYNLFAPAIGKDQVQTQTQIALRFCLSYSAISTTIPGMLTRQHVEENVLASDFGPLLEGERQRFAEIYRSHTFIE